MLSINSMSSLARKSLALRPAVFAATKRSYHEVIVDHYESPRNVGSFDKKDPTVGTGLVGAPACGDVMKLQIKVKDGKIEEAVFKATPKPHIPLSTSLLSLQVLEGR